MQDKVATDSIQLFQYDFWLISDCVSAFPEFKESLGDVAESVISGRETESGDSGELTEITGRESQLVVSVKAGESKIIGKVVESLTSETVHESLFFDVLSLLLRWYLWCSDCQTTHGFLEEDTLGLTTLALDLDWISLGGLYQVLVRSIRQGLQSKFNLNINFAKVL